MIQITDQTPYLGVMPALSNSMAHLFLVVVWEYLKLLLFLIHEGMNFRISAFMTDRSLIVITRFTVITVLL